MRFDWCETNLNIGCGEYKYDHCEMCNIARAYQHGYEIAKDDTPTIDVVKVVRCKDCLYRDNSCGMGEHKWCRCLRQATSPNDYCSYGKRKRKSEVEK